jgi:hypothetical protein
MVVTDAYQQYTPKGKGKGAILRELQGDPLPDRQEKGRM